MLKIYLNIEHSKKTLEAQNALEFEIENDE